ncbi:MAG: isochorismatase family protein, partial [Oscillospiraceae bacterium]|nr:isochorismatase family protein [Oscillospiraceae bacterium]
PAYLEMQEGKKLPVVHCQNGTEGWKLYGKTGEVCKDAMTIGKHTFGSFDLAMLVLHKDYNYDEIEICGVVTNICVMANAVLLKTAQPEAEIIIDALCVGSNDKSLNDKALDVLESMQFTVINR